ncbi:MAG TPA: ABC transporter substrate-binding protein [Tissierellaceae bacterium]|nr:ABC transporter substrate-binding protein [Tissierellaceae bacterium]
MMKRNLVLLLILSLVLSTFLIGCTPAEQDTGQQQDDGQEEEPAGAPEEPVGEIKIGDTTELSGDWVPYWTNNAADYNVYNFITGYGTVDMKFDGEYVVNETVVKDYQVEENEDGSKTYIWTINDNLVYADGTPITAEDYVASALLWSSKQVQDTKGKASYGFYWKGYDAFNTGEKKEFEGVRLLDEYTFSVTIDESNLPYFYELPMVSVAPTQLAYWTDETVEIKDDGEGAYFSDNFTAEAYKERFEKARFGVEDFPASGPYKLVEYDESAKTAVMEVNENYLGNWEGQKPKIKTIIYKKVTNETALNELETGGVDILRGLSSGDEIDGGLDLVEKGGFDFADYPRAGYGQLQFVCDFGPTKDAEVRQAIAHLLDRNDFATAFTGGHGTVVHGPYGEAQWFYQETKADINAKVNTYPYDPEKAKELLEQAGWTLDKDGNEYKEGLRHKKDEDGNIVPLVIEWASSEDNPVSDLLVTKLMENPDVAAVGMEIKKTEMSFDELLNYIYREGAEDPKYGVPTYHMFNLGTGFNPTYDMTTTYTDDPAMIEAGYNTNFIADEELAKFAREMVLVDPEDREGFKENFVNFIVRWNELLPDLPLYSNIYHDFFTDKLKNYETNDIVKISDSLLYAYVEE